MCFLASCLRRNKKVPVPRRDDWDVGLEMGAGSCRNHAQLCTLRVHFSEFATAMINFELIIIISNFKSIIIIGN